MDLDTFSSISLPDAGGTPRRLGDFWAEKPVIVVFVRHFGCLHCREHAADLRARYDEIQAKGAEVVAVGTGDVDYARRFVSDEEIPYPVLVDDDGDAATAASVRRVAFLRLFDPKTFAASRETRRRGYRIHKPGKRVTQLGATLVLGPGDSVRYEHIDQSTVDHAPLDEVLAALP
ncbi:MAG: peroxiredoxin-like family protein [Acidimicrobiia bacterium]